MAGGGTELLAAIAPQVAGQVVGKGMDLLKPQPTPAAPAFGNQQQAAPQSQYQSQFPPVGQGNQSPALASLLTPNNPFLKALMGGR